MTEAAYLEETYAREIESIVRRRIDDRVVLDRTIFYPTGGGQPHDEGHIEFDGQESRVVDVEKTDEIYHTLDGPLPEEGARVTGHLDWDRRYALMRYHTAQHLLSAVLLSDYDARTTGNQLYVDRARIDCAYDRFRESDLQAIEDTVNEYVEDGVDVEWQTMDRDRARAELDPDRTRLRLLPDSITEVRIVEIQGIDRTACAGTHVRNTEEIGRISITGRETKGSDEERIRFVLE
ncbi:MAG: alanine--tRNA ligase-related protein [Halodesulfurarchaeum sp.]